MPGYAGWRLTGEMAIDPSQACRTLALDVRSVRWSTEMLAAVELEDLLLPRLAGANKVMAHVSEASTRETGLPAGLPVVTGGPDHICTLRKSTR